MTCCEVHCGRSSADVAEPVAIFELFFAVDTPWHLAFLPTSEFSRPRFARFILESVGSRLPEDICRLWRTPQLPQHRGNNNNMGNRTICCIAKLRLSSSHPRRYLPSRHTSSPRSQHKSLSSIGPTAPHSASPSRTSHGRRSLFRNSRQFHRFPNNSITCSGLRGRR
jgi:hypothetical protein